MKTTVLFLLAIISFTESISAQNSGGFAGAFTRIGFGARGMGMGNALTAVTKQGALSHYNPALAAITTEKVHIELSAASLEFDRSLQTVSAAFSLPPKAGITLGLIHAGVSDIDGRTVSGLPTGLFDTNEYQIASAFGIRFSERFYGGFGAKLSVSDLNGNLDNETAFGIDLGFLARITEKLNFAFTVQDLISEFTFNSEDLFGTNQAQNVSNSFPTRFKFAGAYQETKWIASAEFEVRTQESEVLERDFIIFDGRPSFFTETNDITTSSSMFRLGGLYHIHERLTLRGGYQLQDLSESESYSFSAGFSIHLPFDAFSPSIDYAFVREPFQISSIHVFALRFTL